MRVAKELVIEPAQSWARLQELKNSEWFIHDVEEQLKENHRLFLEELMRYERQQHLGVAPYERASKRADQANGFYQRTLLTRLGPMELAVPRSRSGLFQTQIFFAGSFHPASRSRAGHLIGRSGERRHRERAQQSAGPGGGRVASARLE